MIVKLAARRTQFETLVQGRHLQWNPYLSLGMPTAAMPAMHPFYPGNFYFLSVAGAVVWTTLVHIFLGMFFAYMLAREIGLSRAGAWVTGLAFGLSGWFLILSFMHHQNSVSASAWIPLALFCVHRWHRSPSRGTWSALTAVVALQLLGGEPQLFMITGMACFLLVVFLAVFKEGGGGARRAAASAAGLFLACVVAVGINSIPVLATLSAMKDSVIVEGFSYAALQKNSTPAPIMLLTMFLPAFQSRLTQAATPDGAYNVGAMLFIGAVTLGLALCSLKSRNRMKWFYGLGLPLFGLLFASGVYNPLFAAARHLPVFNWVRSFIYFHSLVLVGVAVAAGLGVDAILSLEPRARIRRILLGVGIPVVLANGAIAAGALVFVPGDGATLGSFPVIFGIAALVQIGLLLGTAARAPRLGRRALAAAFAVMIGVNYAGIRFGGIQPDPELPRPGPAFRLADHAPEGARIALYTPIEARAIGESRAMNVALLERKPLFSDYYRVIPRRMAGFMNLLSPGYVEYEGEKVTAVTIFSLARNDYFNAKSLQLLGMCAVSHIVTDGREPAYADSPAGAEDMPRLGADAHMAVYGNRYAMPRVYFVEAVEFVADEDAALERMADDSWSPADSVLLEAKERPEPSPGAAPAGPEAVEAVFHPDMIRISVSTRRGGALVVADALAPGWTAVSNGRPAPILPANAVLRGVLLGPGQHEIIMRYSDPANRIGVPLTALSVLILLAVWVSGRFRARGAKPGAAAGFKCE